MPGDCVGVGREMEWPDLDRLAWTADHFDKVAAVIKGGGCGRRAAQAKNWAGIAGRKKRWVSDRQGRGQQQRRESKAVLKMYIKAGTLVEIERAMTASRREKKNVFIEVAHQGLILPSLLLNLTFDLTCTGPHLASLPIEVRAGQVGLPLPCPSPCPTLAVKVGQTSRPVVRKPSGAAAMELPGP